MGDFYAEIAITQAELNDLSCHAEQDADDGGSPDNSQAIIYRGSKAKPTAVIVNWGKCSIHFFARGA